MEYTPSSHGRSRPVTKATLLKMKAAFQNAEKLLRENSEAEAMERKRNEKELEDLFAWL